MRRNLTIVFFCAAFICTTAQAQSWSERMTQTAMNLWTDSFALKPGKPAKWSYDQGVILKGVEAVWKLYGDGRYFNYIRHSMDFYVKDDGTVRDYKREEFNIDHLNNGKVLFLLYQVTGKQKYKKAVEHIRTQLDEHPRTKEGNFWHKKIYPWQVWLDGLYMGQPFYAEYAQHYGQDTAFDDIARQFMLIEQHTRDAKTGLLYHGWDESREQRWADPQTGCSPHFWGRALGWYGMAMVDVLDYFPAAHPGRDSIVSILRRFAEAVVKVQEPSTGLWYDIVDMPSAPKNYREASASCMLAYTLAKGVRMGYLPAAFLPPARKAFQGVLKEFIETDDNGQTNLKGTVAVSGLGGKPYRDGSYDYYMSEPVIVNDPKGIGAFILAATEIELAALPKPGKGKTVTLDRWFNNEWRTNGFGRNSRWHYTWDAMDNGGFSLLGEIWKSYGARLNHLDSAPAIRALRNTDVYIIVDPDGWKDTPQPNYMDAGSIATLATWVSRGGVLLLMANDSANCDLQHFNRLAGRFGIRFTDQSRNMVKGDAYETGAVYSQPGQPIFRKARKMFLKEISVLDIRPPARPVLRDGREVIMATAKFGKGTVVAVGDPWLYNEYVDGRKIPAEYQNFTAAQELAQWLLKQVPAKK